MPNLCDKESYDCNDLIKIVGILRSPEGCPWDRAQDHHTIRNNFLEEAYEAVEAIDRTPYCCGKNWVMCFYKLRCTVKWRRSRIILALMMYAPVFAAR